MVTKCAVAIGKTRKQGKISMVSLANATWRTPKPDRNQSYRHDHRQTANKYLSGQLPTSSGVRQSCPNRSSALVNRRRRIIDEKTWCEEGTTSLSTRHRRHTDSSVAAQPIDSQPAILLCTALQLLLPSGRRRKPHKLTTRSYFTGRYVVATVVRYPDTSDLGHFGPKVQRESGDASVKGRLGGAQITDTTELNASFQRTER